MIGRFFRFLGTVLFSCCDHDNDWENLRFYSDTEYNQSQINRRANSKRQNHYHYDDGSIRANLFAPSPTSVKSSNVRGSFYPTNIRSEASNSSLLSNQIKSPFEQSNGKLNICTSSFPSKSVSSSSSQRPDVVSFVQSNIKSNTSTSSLSTKTVRSSSPQRPGVVYAQSNIKSNTSTSPLSTKTVRSSSPQRPGVVYAQSNIKSNTSTSPLSTKTVRSSSPQRPGIVYAQSNIKSNTSTSPLSTKTVRSSSLLRPDATSLSNNSITEPVIVTGGRYDVKSNSPKNSLASKPLPVVTGGRGALKLNSPEFIASSSSNTSTSSFSTKTVLSSYFLRPDATSLSNNSITEPPIVTGGRYAVKLNSPKNSLASKPLAAVTGGRGALKLNLPEFIPSSSSNTSTSSFSTKTVLSSSFLRPDATLSNNSITEPPIVTGGRYAVKLNSPKNSLASKPLAAVTGGRGALKLNLPEFIASSSSNTLTSSFSTKTVLSSSFLRPDATSLSNNSITEPPIVTGGRYAVKLNSPKNSLASKPLAAVTGGIAVVTGGRGALKLNLPEFIPSSSSNTSTSSFSIKTVLSSSFLRPDATSLSNNSITEPVIVTGGGYAVKSNSLKNSLASKPIAVVTGGRGAVKSNSPKNSLASKPLPAEFIASSSSNAGPDPKEVGKGGTQRYEIPKNIEEMIKNDIVPPVLKMPLSPDTYADYFAALLYAEDFYCEKWSNYLLKDVVLKLREKPNPWLQDQSDKKNSKKGSNSKTQKNCPFVAFKINKVEERRPFLLSRDHVHLRPVDEGIDFEPFHGVLFRVERGTILAEFKDDFHNQHKPSKRYDVSFSFNRVCLKRAHRAVSATASPLLSKILFPKITSLPTQRGSPMDQILNHKLAPIPYLIEYEGRPPSFTATSLINNIVLKIYESCKESRILICAPKNSTCDNLVGLIMEKICKFDIFRANAAFREKELVPDDIMPACIYRGECFTCPPLDELQHFRIITSTFVSTFRLYNAGLKAGHFSHIFLLDASSAIEPETIVALVDLVSEETVIVVTGSVQDQPRWVRSDIGRHHGLKESFFERLRWREPYWSDNPLLKTCI